jgi:hypothetical protein
LIPDTLLSLVLFLAGIGPGYAHVRAAQSRGPRIRQTPLAEFAEYAVIGASCTVISAGLLFAAADALGFVDVGRLLTSTSDYFKEEPGQVLGLGILSLTASYGLGLGSALLVDPRPQREAGGRPGFFENATAWSQTMWEQRPRDHAVLATVELRDGRKILGLVGGFTAETEDNRELFLVGPIALQRTQASRLERVDEQFAVLREQDIQWLVGRYVPAA